MAISRSGSGVRSGSVSRSTVKSTTTRSTTKSTSSLNSTKSNFTKTTTTKTATTAKTLGKTDVSKTGLQRGVNDAGKALGAKPADANKIGQANNGVTQAKTVDQAKKAAETLAQNPAGAALNNALPNTQPAAGPQQATPQLDPQQVQSQLQNPATPAQAQPANAPAQAQPGFAADPTNCPPGAAQAQAPAQACDPGGAPAPAEGGACETGGGEGGGGGFMEALQGILGSVGELINAGKAEGAEQPAAGGEDPLKSLMQLLGLEGAVDPQQFAEMLKTNPEGVKQLAAETLGAQGKQDQIPQAMQAIDATVQQLAGAGAQGAPQ